MATNSSSNDVNVADLKQCPVLDDVKSQFELKSKHIKVSVTGKSLQIYVQEAIKKDGGNTKLDVLFLHGMSFTSQNWVDIKTIYHVANYGHRAVAVDLPGFGKSNCKLTAESDVFLQALISALKMNKPVIVSPSMSGSFSIPFLFKDGKTSTERAIGFVPVAPVNTTEFVNQYKQSQLPTLIVCGTNDKHIGPRSTEDLCNLPKGQYAPIQEAGHACYMNNPDAFHTLLYHFLNQLAQ